MTLKSALLFLIYMSIAIHLSASALEVKEFNEKKEDATVLERKDGSVVISAGDIEKIRHAFRQYEQALEALAAQRDEAIKRQKSCSNRWI